MDKLIGVVDGPFGLLALVMIFFLGRLTFSYIEKTTNRLSDLEEWNRNTLTEALKENTEALQSIKDHCKLRNG